MTGWLDRVEDLLYDGEEVVERVPIADGGIVVTSHRVLAFTPNRDVDRPNVTGVAEQASGEWGFLQQATKAFVVGVVLLIAGQTVSFDSLVGSVSIGSGAAQVGMGGMLGLLSSFLQLMARLDELMTTFGALALLFGVVVFGVFVWTRERQLVVKVDGEDAEDLRLPASEDADEMVQRLERAIRPE